MPGGNCLSQVWFVVLYALEEAVKVKVETGKLRHLAQSRPDALQIIPRLNFSKSNIHIRAGLGHLIFIYICQTSKLCQALKVNCPNY